MKLKSAIRETLLNYKISFQKNKEFNEVVKIINSLLDYSLEESSLKIAIENLQNLSKQEPLIGNTCSNAAVALLGLCYEHGIGVELDKKKAFEMYQKSAEHGNGIAQNNLGCCYKNGIGTECDMFTAIEWFLKAEKQGEAIANFNLGFIGLSSPSLIEGFDKKKCLDLLHTSAGQGCVNAQYWLGLHYLRGSDVEKDIQQGILWYKKAAHQGCSTSQWALTWIFKDGTDVEKDPEQSFEWCKRAAEAGDSPVYQLGLASYYENGFGISKDMKKALFWYKKAAKQGYASAQNNLGYCYYIGNGVDKNLRLAAKWYLKAIEQDNCLVYKGNLERCIDKASNLSEESSLSIQDYINMCEKSFEKGVKKAAFKLAKLYESDTSDPQFGSNLFKARHFFHQFILARDKMKDKDKESKELKESEEDKEAREKYETYLGLENIVKELSSLEICEVDDQNTQKPKYFPKELSEIIAQYSVGKPL